jgi:hypothetical protein
VTASRDVGTGPDHPRRRSEDPVGSTPVEPAPAVVHPHLFERPVRPLPGPRRLPPDAGTHYAANGLVGLVVAATGPLAVILAGGAQGA